MSAGLSLIALDIDFAYHIIILDWSGLAQLLLQLVKSRITSTSCVKPASVSLPVHSMWLANSLVVTFPGRSAWPVY